MICFFLGWSGSVLQFRQNIIKVGSKSWLLTCSNNTTLSLPSYTGSALKRELNFCNGYLSLLYFLSCLTKAYGGAPCSQAAEGAPFVVLCCPRFGNSAVANFAILPLYMSHYIREILSFPFLGQALHVPSKAHRTVLLYFTHTYPPIVEFKSLAEQKMSLIFSKLHIVYFIRCKATYYVSFCIFLKELCNSTNTNAICNRIEKRLVGIAKGQ